MNRWYDTLPVMESRLTCAESPLSETQLIDNGQKKFVKRHHDEIVGVICFFDQLSQGERCPAF